MHDGSLNIFILIKLISSFNLVDSNSYSFLWENWQFSLTYQTLALFFFPLPYSLQISMRFSFYVVATLSTTTTNLHPRPINQLHIQLPNCSRLTLVSYELRCMTNSVRRTLLDRKRDPSFEFEVGGL